MIDFSAIDLGELERRAGACVDDKYDDRWDPMFHGGPLQPDRRDHWEVSSAPSGEPICSLSSFGHWPAPGFDRVEALAKYIAAVPPGVVLALVHAYIFAITENQAFNIKVAKEINELRVSLMAVTKARDELANIALSYVPSGLVQRVDVLRGAK